MFKVPGIMGMLLFIGISVPAQAQTCMVTRDQVMADLASGAAAEDLAVKYTDCVSADPTDNQSSSSVPIYQSEGIMNTGNTYWEAIKSCGYQPQREEANCTVEIRQRYGYNGPICRGPGSHEFLLFCVDYGDGNLIPVHTNGVHVHDEGLGVQPRWNFSATIQSDARLLRQPNRGQTLKARVILSWELPPTSCNYRPIWGNQSDFRFRLDP
jgi:hypothetical protein